MDNGNQEIQQVNMEPSTSPTPPEPAFNPSQPPKRNRKKLIAGIVAVVLLLLVGGCVAAYNLWYQNPQKVVTDSIVNAMKAKSVSLKGSLDVSGEQKVRVEFDGGGEAGRGMMNAKISGEFEGKQITLNGSGLVDDKGDLYVKVKGVDTLLADVRSQFDAETLVNFDKLIGKVNDKWVKVALSDTKTLSEEAAKAQECNTQVFKKFESDASLANEVSDLYKKNQFINIDEKLGSKDGSLGYKLSLKKDTASAFIKGLKDTKAYKMMRDCDSNFSIDEKDLIGNSSSKATTTTELWVSRWSHEVTQLHIESSEGQNKAMMMLSPQFNKAVAVTAPSEFTTVDELKSDIEAFFMSGMSADEEQM